MGNNQARPPNEFVIETPASFDSSFTRISPKSDISDPSNFQWKQCKPTPALQRSNSVVIRNVPSAPPELNGNYRRKERQYNPPEDQDVRPLLRKKKKRRRRFPGKKNLRKARKVFTGCFRDSQHQAERFSKETAAVVGRCIKTTTEKVKDSGVLEKANAAAVCCAKAAVAKVKETEFVKSMKKAKRPAATCPPEETASSGLISYESESPNLHARAKPTRVDQTQGKPYGSADTPVLIASNRSAAVLGLHEEDVYFDQLAREPEKLSGPSPFVKIKIEYKETGGSPVADKRSPVASLFHDPFLEKLGSPRGPNQGQAAAVEIATKRVPTVVSGDSPDQRDVLRRNDSSSAGTPKNVEQIFRRKGANAKAHPANSMASVSPSSRPGKTRGAGIKHSTSGEASSQKNGRELTADSQVLRVTSSAPSIIESHDYRNIALSTTNQINKDHPTGEHARTAELLSSPSVASICSSVGPSPMRPLLSDQVLSNAAFLFSPSYAGQDVALVQRPQKLPDSTFSISTFASRARLSRVSSRSHPQVTIPISSSWSANQRSFEDSSFVHSLDKSNKQVRFSDADDYVNPGHEPAPKLESDADDFGGFKDNPVDLIATRIESKMSDLTDSTGWQSQKSVQVSHAVLDRQQEASPPPVKKSTTPSPDSQKFASPEVTVGSGSSIHWTYQEDDDGKIHASPFIVKKLGGSNSVPAKSPHLRFKTAQTMFANPPKRQQPSRKTPPKKFARRSPKNTLVSNRIVEIHNRISSQQERKQPNKETSNQAVIAPRKGTLINPLFRNPIIMTYSNDEGSLKSGQERRKSQQGTQSPRSKPERQSIDSFVTKDSFQGEKARIQESTSVVSTESAFDDSEFSEDIFQKLMRAREDEADANSVSTTNSHEHDPFNSLMRTISADDTEVQSVPTVRKYRGSGTLRSVPSLGASTHGMSLATDFSEKENISINSLYKSEKGQVNPQTLRRHSKPGSPGGLGQSTQARKWRTLAAAAQEKSKSKGKSNKNGAGVGEEATPAVRPWGYRAPLKAYY